jgi:hypothetical protein
MVSALSSFIKQMSTIHVQHIKNHLETEYRDKIDLSDLGSHSSELTNFFLTRALTAYAISNIILKLQFRFLLML